MTMMSSMSEMDMSGSPAIAQRRKGDAPELTGAP
jgi:hypothetical protein